MNETVGRAWRADQDFQQCRAERGHRLRYAEGEQCEPPPSGEEGDPDRRKGQRPAEAAAEPVEDQRNVRQKGLRMSSIASDQR